MSTYIYAFIRKDLPFEHQLVQLAHAAYEAGKKFQDQVGISNLILFSARDEADINEIKDYLSFEGIEYVSFYEPDYNRGYTSICTTPISGSLRKKFSKWKLYTPA